MKFLLTHFIVVPLIIFTVPLPKGMKADVHYKSCKELYDKYVREGVLIQAIPPSYYNISTEKEGVKEVYCNLTSTNCDGVGWTRVAKIDANSAAYNCSNGNMTYTEVEDKPMCTRLRPEESGCFSMKFPTFEIPYTKVCGRARGYQYGFTRAFHSYEYANQRTLDDPYVSGLSVTRGEPGKREHIWTFAAGFSKAYGYATVNCPDALYPGPHAPTNITGTNYFCDSGNPDNSKFKWHMENRLWTSDGGENAKWFNAHMTSVDRQHSDYIEVRMCRWPPYTKIEDIGVDLLEIYITED